MAYQMLPLWVLIYTPNALQLGGPCLSLNFAILAKGRCFSHLRLKAFVHIAVWINTARGYCWGLRLPKVLKNTTNMFSKYNIHTGTFGHGMKLYMIWKARFEKRMNQFRSYPWKSFSLVMENETDLKGKKMSSSW
jgi:hypothetical protein